MIDFNQIQLQDAQILRTSSTDQKLTVEYSDWQGQKFKLIFEQVAGYESFSPEGKDLSHGQVDFDDRLLKFCCHLAEESSIEDFKVYSFVSAWNDTKILRVVAKSFVLTDK